MAFEYRFTLGMSSVDAAGVLFYPELFRHAHDAYEALMREAGFGLAEVLREGRHALPVVHAEADYRMPMRHGDDIRVSLAVVRLGESSFTIEAEFNNPPGVLAARVQSVHVWVERSSGQAAPLPEVLRVALEKRRAD